MKIIKIIGREILDSRGNPTVEVDVYTAENPKTVNRGVAPSGASTGVHEAVELRDAGSRYLGKGVRNAVDNVNEKISKGLVGKNIGSQKDADELLKKIDGTFNKSVLGANAMVATSMAVARAFAAEAGEEYFNYLGGKKLPNPMFNILNGGKHAGTKLSIQEFMIMPQGKNFSETLQMASETYHILGKLLVKKYGAIAKNVGDEGGYAPPIEKTGDAIEIISKAIEEAGYQKKTSLALDCAASSFYDSVTRTYHVDGEEQNSSHLMEFYIELVKKYRIKSVEDPFEEEAFSDYAQLLEATKGKADVVGDDLVVTNIKRLDEAKEKKSINALLLKVNQIGTVTEALGAREFCRKNGMKTIVSHRSGETEDTFIADFAVGTESDGIKTGAPARGERTAKYNRLLRIEEVL